MCLGLGRIVLTSLCKPLQPARCNSVTSTPAPDALIVSILLPLCCSKAATKREMEAAGQMSGQGVCHGSFLLFAVHARIMLQLQDIVSATQICRKAPTAPSHQVDAALL